MKNYSDFKINLRCRLRSDVINHSMNILNLFRDNVPSPNKVNDCELHYTILADAIIVHIKTSSTASSMFYFIITFLQTYKYEIILRFCFSTLQMNETS